MAISTFAQQGINYKALIKDGSGNVVASQNIDIKFSIIEDGGATVVYAEEHLNKMTDANGVIILNIGEGTPTTNTFASIAWGSETHSLKTEIDIEQDTTFEDLGTTAFNAVPYALHADSSSQSATANRLILKNGTSSEFDLFYDTPGDKLKITENGVSGSVLEITGGELYLPQYAGSNNGPLKVDATGKVITEPLPQTTSYNRFEFTNKEVSTNSTKLQKGVQFPDGTVITGVKAFLMDNDTSGNTGIGNTVFAGIYRTSKTSSGSLETIYRIDGSDTPTGQFNEFTQTTLGMPGSNVIDNTNYIYLLQVWYCNACLLQEISVMNN